MKPPKQRTVLSAALGVLLLGAVAAAQEQTSAPEPRVRLTATLKSVDTEVQEIRLLTGTGLAVRIERARVAASCQIKVGGQMASLTDLKTGSIVRVECVERGASLVALVIETVPPAAEERKP